MEKVLHLNAGNETGGGMHHILDLLQQFNHDRFTLGVLEEGEMLHRARRLGIHTVSFANHAKFSFPLLRHISQYITQNNISIVHTHGPRANVYVNILRRMAKFHWVVTIHSDPKQDFMSKGIYGNLLSNIHLRAIKNADKIITIAKPLSTGLLKAGIKKDKILEFFNGIDFQAPTPPPHLRHRFGISDEDFVLLMVARLEKVKGHHLALEAFKQLLKQEKRCHLLLIGDGSLKESLREKVINLKMTQNVQFLGYRKDVQRFYGMADVTLLSSLSEGFPLVLLESARAKTPVITTDVGSVSELMVNSSVGWKVKPNSVAALVNAMEEALLLRKRHMLKPMGHQLHAHASKKFALEHFANHVEDLYTSMLG